MNRARRGNRARDEAVREVRREGERNDEAISSANRERAQKRTMATALRMLAARSLSEGQLRERLLARPSADGEAIDKCISRLKEMGLIDDSLFARSYADYRVRTKPMGRSRLARELAGKKVSRDEISGALDEVFDEVGEEALIDRAIEKRVRTHGRAVDRAGVRRMFDHLARLGFSYDLIWNKLRALGANDEEEVANDES
ncbi:MAG: RecX family transcriptional regulator [Blastocatellia bacterium]|nr:RecX family transcriptional regulator [Blastocatellia bacterium]